MIVKALVELEHTKLYGIFSECRNKNMDKDVSHLTVLVFIFSAYFCLIQGVDRTDRNNVPEKLFKVVDS